MDANDCKRCELEVGGLEPFQFLILDGWALSR
jgi:hypothetical protein